MHRYGIEEETWFESARTALERLGFTLRLQPKSIIIEKAARLPRIVGCAREFLEFAERQGVQVAPAAFLASDVYGDSRSELGHRASMSPFETPGGSARTDASVGPAAGWAAPSDGRTGLAELPRGDATADDSAIRVLTQEKRAIQARCTELEAELARLGAAAGEAATQRDLYQMSAVAAEQRVTALQAELEAAVGTRAGDRRFEQLRRFLARELHPDLAGENANERSLRESIFKRVWSKIEQMQ